MKQLTFLLLAIINLSALSQTPKQAYPTSYQTGFVVKYKDPINGDIQRETTSLKVNNSVYLSLLRSNDKYWSKYTILNVEKNDVISKGDTIVFQLENGSTIECYSTERKKAKGEIIGDKTFYKLKFVASMQSASIDKIMLSPITNIIINNKEYKVSTKKWTKKGIKMCQRIKYKQ